MIVFDMGWVTLSANFRGNGSRPSTTAGVRKLEFLGCHLAFLRDRMFSPVDTIPTRDRRTDRQTDGRAHDDG